MSNNKQSMKNNPQQNENNNAKHQFSNTEVMTFSQQTEFLKTMSNNKQSSVDILCQKLANKLGLQAITFYIDHQEEIAEAKAMHKQECVDLLNHHNDIFDTSEEHYNKTFGGN